MSKVNEYLKLIDEVIENGQYKADWASLSNIPEPEWYKKASLVILDWEAFYMLLMSV